MTNIINTKIGPSSRYFESLTALRFKLKTQNLFKQVHNPDKGTYSPPYLYRNYKNELEPIPISDKIIQSIKTYLDENLFNAEEKKLLVTALTPSIEEFGNDTINFLTNYIKLAIGEQKNDPIIIEYKKTIESLKKINEIINAEFSNINFMDKITEPEVFISYSHDSDEHKAWVLQLATRLRSQGVNVILDQWNLKLGSDLASFMEQGLSRAHRVICVCSDNYVKKANGGLGGSGYEKRIMTAELIKDQNNNLVIPLIRNNSSKKLTPTFLSGQQYINFTDSNLYEKNYEELLRDLLDEPILPIPPIGKNPFQNIQEFAKQSYVPANEKYVSPSVSGIVEFDYSNNNGRYVIGQGELMFETHWSKKGGSSIYILNNPPSIAKIAVTKDVTEIKNIKDARIYDGSSNTRSVHLNQIAVLQNSNGFYAAVKTLKIEIDSDGKGDDKLIFEYRIQTNGSPDFTE